jgi:catechol 2,3-dioxygenase-like lactoylglutathione lyase family enzyme
MELERIDHVGLNVRDLRASADFYSRVFGFGILHKWTTTWMVGTEVIRLGLFQRPVASPVCNIDNAVALTHLALRTDATGFATAQQELRSLGIPFDDPEDTGIAYSIFVLDPDGHQIEITTYDRPSGGVAN